MQKLHSESAGVTSAKFEAPDAYPMFRGKQDQCTKVVLKPWAERRENSMPLLNAGVNVLETKLPKLISPSVHGIIDYSHAAFFFMVGFFCTRTNTRAASAAFATGGLILVQSLLTDYPLGVKPLLSFETHGKMDALMASSSWHIPQVFGLRGTPAAKVFELNSLAEASVVGMTEWNSAQSNQAA